MYYYAIIINEWMNNNNKKKISKEKKEYPAIKKKSKEINNLQGKLREVADSSDALIVSAPTLFIFKGEKKKDMPISQSHLTGMS